MTWPQIDTSTQWMLLERLPPDRWWRRHRRTIPKCVPTSRGSALNPPDGYTGHLDIFYTTRHQGHEYGIACMVPATSADSEMLRHTLEQARFEFARTFGEQA